MRAGEAPNYFREWLACRFEKHFGKAGRQWSSERVAVAASIFNGDGARFASDAHAYGAASVDEFGNAGGHFWTGAARGNFGVGQIA